MTSKTKDAALKYLMNGIRNILNPKSGGVKNRHRK